MSSLNVIKQEKADLEMKIFYDIQKFEKKHGVVISNISCTTYEGPDGPDIEEVFLKISL